MGRFAALPPTMSTVFEYECVETACMNRANIPKVFVETGTYRGDGIAAVMNSFREVHSIELKLEFVEAARRRFERASHVHVHHGDSATVLAELCESIKEPAIFYLDAHYSGGETAFGLDTDNGCPILRELQVIGKRPYDDVVFVDDMRLMGKASYSGTPGDSIYPLTYFDFSHATYKAMLTAYNKPCVTYACKHNDRMILIPKQLQSV